MIGYSLVRGGFGMDLVRKVTDLKIMKTDIYDRLIKLYTNYLSSDCEFPYLEVNNLFSKYDVLYCKISKRINNRFPRIKTIKSDDIRGFSKFEIEKEVSERVLAYIYLDVGKYVPFDLKSKQIIFNKLLPIFKNFDFSELADIYKKFKISASIRGIMVEGDLSSFVQQLFVDYIMLSLSHNLGTKYSDPSSLWTYESVCEQILKEPILRVNSNDIKKFR